MFERLKESCREDWERYIQHDFVRQLGDGTLPKECFEHYLKQDYIFLIHFARAYALAIYKSERIEDMRQAKASLAAILDDEISLHLAYCRDWGLSEAEILAVPEATPNMAYTRYVLERGSAGSLLDLHVALAPCVVGYAEVATWLLQQPWTKRQDNPYGPWIDTYAGEDYQKVARGQIDLLARLGAREATEERFPDLARTFRDATRLEIGFWDMGLKLIT